MTKFNLTITPAIPIELRHKIADLLKQEGYNVWSQGQFLDNRACDINFDERKNPTSQDLFFNSDTKVSTILPGGMGSGKKSMPIRHCSVCNELQFDTPSGPVCKNGHGGADSIEDQ